MMRERTLDSFIASFGRICRDFAILFELAEAQWLAPDIEEIDEAGPAELAMTTPTILTAEMPVALQRRIEHLRRDLNAMLLPIRQNTPWYRSTFPAKGQQLVRRLEEAERTLKEAWLNASHRQSALDFYRVTDAPEALGADINAILASSPLATGPWKAVVEEFDDFRWSLMSPVAETVQHILTLSLMVYSSRCFRPQISPDNRSAEETRMPTSLQLPDLHLSWSTAESLHRLLESLVEGREPASSSERRESYLGIQFDPVNMILNRDGWTISVPLEQALIQVIFSKLYRLEGALWSLSAIKSTWPGKNWSPKAVQKAMSSLRIAISPLSLDVKNDRTFGYRLAEKTRRR